jgi:hypothetical protein
MIVAYFNAGAILRSVEERAMMTIRDIEKLPAGERAVTRASYQYYRALLQGAPDPARQRLRRLWLSEIHRRWPDAWR